MRTGSPNIAGANVTKVRVIDAFANYFKHHEEWPAVDWSALPPREKATADVITAAGAEQRSSRNFRAGAKALGNANLDNLVAFAEAVIEWRENVAKHCEAKLRKGRLM